MEFERGKAYVVDRGDTKPRYGQGMVAGLGVVLKHFRDAFGKKLDSPSQTSGVFTVQYPEERLKLPEASRSFPILLYDDASGQELCTSCFQCERICPPQVIHMTQAKDPTTGKAVPAVAEFLLEYDACMSCGLCAEVCPFDAIKMDQEFELSTDVHGGLTIDKAGLNRPISHYERLAPTFWAEVQESATKKLQGTVKRRTGDIGRATTDRPATSDQRPTDASTIETTALASNVGAQRAAPLLPAPQPAPAETQHDAPVLPAPADAPADAKAAKLAAIRAANAAKATAAASNVGAQRGAPILPAPQPAPAETQHDAPADAPADAKAAKLAAIRAANAAKATAATSDGEAQPADAKAAKLAAIRAANAAKAAARDGDSAV